jgi:hypothetical protein
VTFPRGSREAVDLAQRMGLLASILRSAPPQALSERIIRFVREAPEEEIRYWVCKLMDKRVGEQRAVAALCILSGSGRVRQVSSTE